MRDTATAHGFRSTFRDWGGELGDYPNELLELAIAHAVGDKVEAAYRRGKMLAKRHELMMDWERYCGSATGGPTATNKATANAGGKKKMRASVHPSDIR